MRTKGIYRYRNTWVSVIGVRCWKGNQVLERKGLSLYILDSQGQSLILFKCTCILTMKESLRKTFLYSEDEETCQRVYMYADNTLVSQTEFMCQ